MTIAARLHKTVSELQNSMSNREFSRWVQYYLDFPFDDYHLHYKPAALIAGFSGMGGKINERIEEALTWLQPEQLPEGMSEADMSIIKTFGG